MAGEIVDFGLAEDFKQLLKNNPEVEFPNPSLKDKIENEADWQLLKVTKTIGSAIKIIGVEVVTTDLVHSVMSK